MSKELVESILDKDFVLAESHFNDVLNNIMEKKLYEKKRMVAAQMDEVLGGMTRAEIEAKKKAGYKKASDVLQDPRDIKIKPLVATKKDKKKVSEAVEVAPDPEGRVRGGSAKKGTFKRKAAAAAIKAVRKAQVKVGDVAGNVAVGASRAKTAFDMFQQQRAEKSKESAKRKVAPDTVKQKKERKDYEGLGNTPSAMYGRLKQHVSDKVSDYKPSKPGSGTLKVAKGIGRAVLSDILAAARP